MLDWIKKHTDAIVVVLAVLGGIIYSNHQLANVSKEITELNQQLLAIQGQVAENQTKLDQFLHSYLRERNLFYGDETPADSGSTDK